jgi:Homeodomain-like domain
MPRTRLFRIVLDPDERLQLEALARRYTSPYRDVVRAKIILYAADGLRNAEIAARLDLPRQIVSKWRNRFFRQRLARLEEQSRRGRPPRFSPRGSWWPLRPWHASFPARPVFRCRDLVSPSSGARCCVVGWSPPSVRRLCGAGWMRMRSDRGAIGVGSSRETQSLKTRQDAFWICVRGSGKAVLWLEFGMGRQTIRENRSPGNGLHVEGKWGVCL